MQTQAWLIQLKQSNDCRVKVNLIGQLADAGIKNTIISKETEIRDYQVRHYLRVYRNLVPEVMSLFQAGRITFSMARAIASLDEKKQEKAARDTIAKGTSVNGFRNKLKDSTDKKLTAELERQSELYSGISGLDITIKPDKHNPKAGVWLIRYADLDMYDVIADRIGNGKTLDDF
ncbi:hypothetical protein D0C16_08030 [Cellvibrio sp. KY-GH-1]|nr:hypothetical protein D0C16_08030 [Cellvibrio sp. KY-GH-1]